MHRRPSGSRRAYAGATTATVGGALPPLVRADAATTKWLVPATADAELSGSASHLRAVVRHSQTTKATKQHPHKPITLLEPLRRGPYVSSMRGNNDAAESDREDTNQHVLTEIWRVATATAKQHSEKSLYLPGTHRSNNETHGGERRIEKPESIPLPDDGPPTSGTTLARFRRLVGMHARKTLFQILKDTAVRVTQNRLEGQSSGRIQRLARRFLERRRRERLRYEHVAAAETLQRMWRGRVARRRLQQLKQADAARRRAERRRIEAVKTIQRGFRRHQQLVRMEERRKKTAEIRLRHGLGRAVLCWRQHRRTRQTPLQADPIDESPPVVQMSPPLSSVPVRCPLSGPENDHVVGLRLLIDKGDDMSALVLETYDVRTPSAPPSHAAVVVSHSLATSELWHDYSSATLIQTPTRGGIHHCTTPKKDPAIVLQSRCQIQSHTVSDADRSTDESDRDCVEKSMHPFTVDLTHQTQAYLRPQHVTRVDPNAIADDRFLSGLTTIGTTSMDGPARSLPTNPVNNETTTAELIAITATLSHLTTRRAFRLLTHFIVFRCLPFAQFSLSTTHAAATRIQQCVRQHLARQQLHVQRQLHLIALRSELQTHWIASETELLASIFGVNEYEAAETTLYSRPDTEQEADDEDDLVFDVDDEENRICGEATAGPAWTEVLPTRGGRLPHNLQIDFSRGGPASGRAPSLGLWKWSWVSERWEPRRDLFELHTLPMSTDP